MKRCEVSDLFFGDMKEPLNGIWHEFSNPDALIAHRKVKVKTPNKETFAYFYPDKAAWIVKFGQKTSYFWDCSTREPLHDVTHWMELKKVNHED